MNTDPIVTILIPNYKTYNLTKTCLELLREHTDLQKAKIVVIDNDSQDESVNYLRSLNWIELIERKVVHGESGPLAHSRALDLALENVATPYVLSIHTDTLIKSSEWLDFLLQHIDGKTSVAGVGSWKLENQPWHKRTAKAIERKLQLAWHKIVSKQHRIAGIGENYYYLRSHCALYRMDLIIEFNLTFSDGNNTAGKVMHKKLVAAGYEMIFLPSSLLSRYIEHINHATSALNPIATTRKKTIQQGLQKISKWIK